MEIGLREIVEAQDFLRDQIVETPFINLSGNKIRSLFTGSGKVKMKLEFLQHVGSFKSRGVLLGLSKLTSDQKRAGVIAFSAGNHALAVSWASKVYGINAKVIMPNNADEFRIEGCRAYGAEILLADNAADGFSLMQKLSISENRQIMHPFEADHMILGAATCGFEMINEMSEMEAIIIPIGGGGLISGIATAIKLVRPTVKVYGVEPFGADSMFQSFSKNRPVIINNVNTIADSLGAPMALPKSYKLARMHVDEIVRLSDIQMITSMNLIREKLNFLVEPACASSLAAYLGPLKDKLLNKNVALIACGSNISFDRYRKIVHLG